MNLSKRTRAPKTSNRRLSSIREFGRAILKTEILVRYNAPTPPEAEPHPLPRLAKDLDALIENCNGDRQACLIALCGLMGLRLHEALFVQPCHVNVRDMTLLVYGKGNKQRIIPITTRAWEYISPALIEAMFTGMTQPLVNYSDRGARSFITELGVKARISRPISSHDLRATFATVAYIKTKDLVLVQRWLGHADPKQTLRYIQSGLDIMRGLEM